jgi:hypothetical protein
VGAALVAAAALCSRAGDGIAAMTGLVFASWIGWATLAVCTALAEARRASPPTRELLDASPVAANDDEEFAIVVRLRR